MQSLHPLRPSFSGTQALCLASQGIMFNNQSLNLSATIFFIALQSEAA
jgi:hypothetical protein